MNMQQIIAQEAQVYNIVTRTLPTIGMLVSRGETDPLAAVVQTLLLQNFSQQDIAALQPELERCIERVKVAAQTPAL